MTPGFLCGLGRRGDARTREIEARIAQDRRKLRNQVRLLMIGTGESGKSTLVKQLRVGFASGFSEGERLEARWLVRDNIMESMSAMIAAMARLEITPTGELRSDIAQFLKNEKGWSPSLVALLSRIWQSEELQEVWSKRTLFHVMEAVGHFLDEIERIGDANYMPSDQDIILARKRSLGVNEISFKFRKVDMHIIDVGGQKTERRKWIHCFQDLTAMIFVVGVSEYDQTLFEDDVTNRLQDSLQEWKLLLENQWLASMDVILFLNKIDLFASKIRNIDLNVCFPEYTEGKRFAPGISYVRQRFLECVGPKRAVYPHMTNATDTDNIVHVFDAVTDIILRQIMTEECGL